MVLALLLVSVLTMKGQEDSLFQTTLLPIAQTPLPLAHLSTLLKGVR